MVVANASASGWPETNSRARIGPVMNSIISVGLGDACSSCRVMVRSKIELITADRLSQYIYLLRTVAAPEPAQ